MLLGGWLTARLGVTPSREVGTGKIMEAVRLDFASGRVLTLRRDLNGGTALLQLTEQRDRVLPLVRRPHGEELAEELRRLDPDQSYAAALAAATGTTGLDYRSPTRVHVWKDPAPA
jgi:glucose-6-phosphate dehydrogenase assembly protein OpcA